MQSMERMERKEWERQPQNFTQNCGGGCAAVAIFLLKEGKAV